MPRDGKSAAKAAALIPGDAFDEVFYVTGGADGWEVNEMSARGAWQFCCGKLPGLSLLPASRSASAAVTFIVILGFEFVRCGMFCCLCLTAVGGGMEAEGARRLLDPGLWRRGPGPGQGRRHAQGQGLQGPQCWRLGEFFSASHGQRGLLERNCQPSQAINQALAKGAGTPSPKGLKAPEAGASVGCSL